MAGREGILNICTSGNSAGVQSLQYQNQQSWMTTNTPNSVAFVMKAMYNNQAQPQQFPTYLQEVVAVCGSQMVQFTYAVPSPGVGAMPGHTCSRNPLEWPHTQRHSEAVAPGPVRCESTVYSAPASSTQPNNWTLQKSCTRTAGVTSQNLTANMKSVRNFVSYYGHVMEIRHKMRLDMPPLAKRRPPSYNTPPHLKKPSQTTNTTEVVLP
ncbi:hypothetical protein ERJ75_001614800 [Trypanosoma vivax]|uniref:Uncharacterized protein n=1 Tax=Trypanosoma vivax (strain Y486) TaxID=1055687 RepID=G0TTG4_TRYVY|nr:hypothetical protein TRVL_06816 [Trypanosoma vivax]KAH8605790.1 hypothetical protein ERJ75_001614800 [Trypanosoma vivax]CCC47245.1 conserved hypothetical protein [Trypanosoma vivax Y486]